MIQESNWRLHDLFPFSCSCPASSHFLLHFFEIGLNLLFCCCFNLFSWCLHFDCLMERRSLSFYSCFEGDRVCSVFPSPEQSLQTSYCTYPLIVCICKDNNDVSQVEQYLYYTLLIGIFLLKEKGKSRLFFSFIFESDGDEEKRTGIWTGMKEVKEPATG